MVQREIKRKTGVYGLVAVLLAVTLVGTIYTISSPTFLLTASNISPMKTFSSLDELKNYLTTNTKADSTSSFSGGVLDAQFLGFSTVAPVQINGYSSTEGTTKSYSTTNIQVAGVDEADTVKTDGKYIYTLTPDNITCRNVICILNADPQDTKIISRIKFDDNTFAAGMFLSQDGNKLVILGSIYENQVYTQNSVDLRYFFSNVKTFVYVYDISDKSNPSLAKNSTLSGSYFNSRMIGEYVYTVVSEPAYLINDNVSLPHVYNNTGSLEISPTEIYYADTTEDDYFTYTIFAALNVNDDSQASTLTVLMGSASNMYVSQTNLYVTCPVKNGQVTAIYRVNIDGTTMSFQAKGGVPGYILNQYSMDEYNDYFRVATTTPTGSWINEAQQNNVYVLNSDLTVAGKVENIATGEKIYAARFMGDKGYLVTFKQTDPFFVLDLSNPSAPVVAGELKIPGYSSYLHPYDENHVIGVGMENSNVKLSLFDVTEPSNPVLMATYIVTSYSYSQALYNPKAFLFDYSKNLLVLPIDGYNYGYYDSSTEEVTLNSYWQGAFIFKLSLDGFDLQGTVTHLENGSSTYYYNYNQIINRELFIGNTLYTISDSKVQLNNLDTLELIATVNLQ